MGMRWSGRETDEGPTMRVGMIGAGQIGLALATHLARAGVTTLISNRRGAASLTAQALALGPSVTATSRQEARSATSSSCRCRGHRRAPRLLGCRHGASAFWSTP